MKLFRNGGLNGEIFFKYRRVRTFGAVQPLAVRDAFRSRIDVGRCGRVSRNADRFRFQTRVFDCRLHGDRSEFLDVLQSACRCEIRCGKSPDGEKALARGENASAFRCRIRRFERNFVLFVCVDVESARGRLFHSRLVRAFILFVLETFFVALPLVFGIRHRNESARSVDCRSRGIRRVSDFFDVHFDALDGRLRHHLCDAGRGNR